MKLRVREKEYQVMWRDTEGLWHGPEALSVGQEDRGNSHSL